MQKNKSYYRALCACLALLVIGGATAYYGVSQGNQKQSEPKQQKPMETAQMPIIEEPITEQVIYNQSESLEQAKAEREDTNLNTSAVQENAIEAEPEMTAESAVVTEETVAINSGNSGNSVNNELSATADPIFESPLQGEVVMDYSMEHAIYDPTLDQFRTNNCISIGSKEGDTVKASADGTIANVVEQTERGITVVINHNNGWETTYSQLNSDVLVKKGDDVKKGQDIGVVGKTTKYGAALGEHLDFAMIKDGQYVDPKEALAQ